ncbi:NADP-dependent 3-hydroxy acid dehydrogenase YdfG [Rhizobium pisi]|uniref:NADP-dependent 3-hydroxy acid dehydrogenase YdfG n=1 Tax=Rhizobium pisi TaxID=574561 RepID=A0A7W5BIS1_9HYPH|nr:NADP-dependent 3-hydroxy acid dehydrogenase YdfG [Rhizobium pisi]
MTQRLSRKIAVITGASSGIGLATAKRSPPKAPSFS